MLLIVKEKVAKMSPAYARGFGGRVISFAKKGGYGLRRYAYVATLAMTKSDGLLPPTHT
jgi:hypothetical protein